MKCIIADDELNSREALRQLLEIVAPDIMVIAEAPNTAQAKKLIDNMQPDLLFLDINMPGQTGIEFLEENPDLGCNVIFTTAYNEYAVKAFRLNAIDFLLKPIDMDELKAAVEKVKTQDNLISKEQLTNAKNIVNNMDDNSSKRLALSTTEGIHFVNMDDIVWMEALGPYTKFMIAGEKPITVSRLLKDFEELLVGFKFLRVHQSSIINLDHIKKYVKGNGGQLWMSDGTEIEVRRRKKDELLEALKKIAIK